MKSVFRIVYLKAKTFKRYAFGTSVGSFKQTSFVRSAPLVSIARAAGGTKGMRSNRRTPKGEAKLFGSSAPQSLECYVFRIVLILKRKCLTSFVALRKIFLWCPPSGALISKVFEQHRSHKLVPH